MIRARRATVAAFFALVAGCPLAFSAPALAQNTGDRAAAEALYNEAMKLIADKRFPEACPKLEESMRLDPGIGIMLHLASCYEKTQKAASAWALFREAQQIATREGDKRADAAKKRADALEPTLHKLTIVVPKASDVAGLEVRRDGSLVGRGQWGTAVPIDPGEHAIAATATGKTPWTSTVKTPAEKGETSVTVPPLGDAPAPVVSAPPTPTPTASTPQSATSATSAPLASTSPGEPLLPTSEDSGASNGRRVAGLAIAGVGVVGVGIGAYFGLHTKSKLDESNADNNCQPNNHCNATGASLRHDAQSAGTVSTVAFGIGLLAIAGGAVVYFTAPKADAAHTGMTVTPTVGASGGGVILRGSF